ncbi:MAG: hypothetical protein HYV15_01390 [Elusimicrobia bacterium]|nr:hypothetical protein [Elusimicrobiota bacterium]
MLCPLCRARCEPNMPACPACGVDFMKWLHLQGRRAEAPAPRRSAASAIARRGALWAGLLSFFIVLGRRAPSGDASSGVRGPAHAPGASLARARLEPLLRRAGAEGYGVELSMPELLERWRAGEASLGEGTADAWAGALGLAAPRTMPLGEREAATRGKCLREGRWAYGSLPSRPEAGVECWSLALEGPRRWVLQHWLRGRKAWASYPEGDLRRAWARQVETAYPPEREQALREAAARAVPLPPEARRAALLDYYGFLAEAEGARAALGSL